MKILFVCTANICRSFMAEYIFKKKCADKHLNDISIISASLIDMKGSPADPNAVRILEENGISIFDHTSKLITQDMSAEADMILVMTRQHRDKIVESYPDAEDKIFLLKPFSIGFSECCRNGSEDIKDPYRLSRYHYRVCFDEICMSVEGLINCIYNTSELNGSS